MIQVSKIAKTLGACLAGAALITSFTAQAGVISVNFREFATDVQQIDSDETFGITNLGTVVGGWMNVNAGANNLTDSEGNATTVNLINVLQPNGMAALNAIYADTPLSAGFDDYTGTVNPTSFTLTNLNANFPNGYKLIVYVGGFNGCSNATISDGAITYHYGVLNPPVAPVTFVQITNTINPGSAKAPIGQYAVFGDPTLLTGNAVTITLNTIYGGGSGLGGVQIVGQTAADGITRIWKGNLNNNWDTSTLNWTNNFLGATNYADGNIVVFNDAAVAASPTVNLTAAHNPLSVTVDSTKNYTITGSGIAGATGLTKKGAGSLTLSNPNTYSNNTVISAGTLKLGTSGVIPDGAGFGSVSVATGATFDLNGNSEGINGLTGTGILDNTGGAATLSVGLADTGGTFAGTIQGAVSLTKLGTNTLTLTNTTSHTGTTRVGQGTLALNPLSNFSANSPLVVSNGATLAVNITNNTGLFTSSSVSLNGGTALTVDFGNAAPPGSTTPITTFGALNLTGVSQIGIYGNSFAVGSYTLISYSSKTGGSISATPAFLPTGMVATISDTGSAIVLNVTSPSIQTLLWTIDNGNWDTNGSASWNLGNAFYTEYSPTLGDSVQFDNSNFGTVTVVHDVHPYAVQVAGNYTLVGPGRITGATGIERTGFTSTTFILANTNTYTGVTTVSGGTLQINNASALGSATNGTVVLSGGSLALSNGITLSGEPLTLNGQGISQNGALRTVDTNSPITVSAPITLGSTGVRIRSADRGELILAGPITDNGSNYNVFIHAAGTNAVLRLNSSGNVASNVTVYGVSQSQGRIIFGVTNVFPNSSLTVGGGVFDLNGNNQNFAGLRDGFEPNRGILTNSSASPVTLTLNYSDTNSTASFLSVLGGAVNVVKQGIGVQSFGGGTNIVHTYSGTTTINGGVLGVSSDFSQVTGSFTVNNGGTLRGSGNTIGGPVTVNAGGTFYAGFASNAIGTLTISNSLTLAGNTIVALDKDLAQSNDVVNVTGALSYGGTLTVYNINTNGTPFVVGDTFPVFPAGGSGNFSAILSDPGVTFSFSPTTGVLTVDSVGAVSPPTLNYGPLGGGAFQFSWTEPGFKLQWQTNAASAGLKTNWVDYPGGGTSPVNVTNNPAIPTTFFRLSQ